MTRASLALGLALAIAGCSSRGNLQLGMIEGPRSISGKVEAYRTNQHTIAVPRAGNLVIRLTWQDPTVDLELYLGSVSCPALYPTNACPISAASRSAVGAVEEVARTVNAGRQYSVFVDNLDPKRGQNYRLTLEVR